MYKKKPKLIPAKLFCFSDGIVSVMEKGNYSSNSEVLLIKRSCDGLATCPWFIRLLPHGSCRLQLSKNRWMARHNLKKKSCEKHLKTASIVL